MTAPMQDSQCTQHKVWFCAFSTEAESQIREPMHLSMRALAEAQWVSKIQTDQAVFLVKVNSKWHPTQT